MDYISFQIQNKYTLYKYKIFRLSHRQENDTRVGMYVVIPYKAGWTMDMWNNYKERKKY